MPFHHAIDRFAEALKLREDPKINEGQGSRRALQDLAKGLLSEVVDLLTAIGLDSASLKSLKSLQFDLSVYSYPPNEAVSLGTEGVGYFAMRIWNSFNERDFQDDVKTYEICFTAAELELLRFDPPSEIVENASPLSLKHKITRAKILANADREGVLICTACYEPWSAHEFDSHGDESALGDDNGVYTPPSGTCVQPPCAECNATGHVYTKMSRREETCLACNGKGGPGRRF